MIILTAFVLTIACNIACNALQVLSFQPNNNRLLSNNYALLQRSGLTVWAIPPESSPADEMPKEEKEIPKTKDASEREEKTTLTLQGEISVASNDLPKTSIEDVSEFFQTQAYRNLLVTGGGERPCSEVEITTQQLNDWKIRCLTLGAHQPDENDSILSVVTRGFEFPGLKVKSNAVIGVKYIENGEEEIPTIDGRKEKRRSPRYEFVLLANEQTASGLAPAVWIFRKLTGADKNGNEDNSKFKSLSTVTYEEKDNGNIAFQIDAFLSIGITFPKFLLKILPGDKKTIEERGGKSIIKTLDKDVVQSIESFEKAYLKKFGF